MKTPRYLLRESVILKILTKYNIKSFFEFGYGSGELLLTLSKLELSGYGYDFSSAAYNLVERKIKNNDVNNIYLIKDLEETNNKKFQAILFFEVIGYFNNPSFELNKLSQMLSDNGLMIFSFTNKNSQGFAEKATGDMKCYTKEEIMEILFEINFQPIEIINYGFPLTNIMKIFLNLYHRFKFSFNAQKNKKEQIEQSGLIKKDLFIGLMGIFCNKYTFLPFILIQSIFQKSNLGNGFIVVCNKVK
jgi:SAM-dependent methyltransferase